jgi:hypothetical protein
LEYNKTGWPYDEAKKEGNPKDNAATDRIDISLFPDTAVVYGALAMTEGHLKYGGYNYRPIGVSASVYYSALRRHMAKWFNGENDDPKTGVPHLANAIGCLAVLIDSIEARVLVDDRPPIVDVADLIERARWKVKHLQKMFPNGPKRYTQKDLECQLGNCGSSGPFISTRD